MPTTTELGYGPPYGVGTSQVAPVAGGKMLRDPFTGDSHGSRRIDPKTRDYVVDATYGLPLGMSNAQQLVHLAVSTDKGSSAVVDLGQELASIARITNNFETRVTNTLLQAVQHIVDANIIEVVDVVVARIPNKPFGASGVLRWRDLTVDPEFADQTTPVN